jgi:hypothetical protein
VIDPGEEIYLKPNVLRALCTIEESLCVQRLYSPSQTIVVEKSLNPVRPEPVIFAALKVGLCDEFLLELFASKYDGGRVWSSIEIEVSSDTGNVTRLNHVFRDVYKISPLTRVPLGYFESPY